ncbi:MAG: hypothetical protein C4530_01675 [Desulfobacteraceae bacterium]|nr:MAG: hypothetical protein C4530_01675 [Desulfobacteraceae bacterium]
MMRTEFLTDDSERSLAPFFSPPLLSATATGLYIVGCVLLLFWPRQELFRFIGTNSEPLLFFQVFSTAALVQAYLNLRCGRGEMVKQDDLPYFRKEVSTHETERNFLRYGLKGFLLHTIFLILPFLPLLLVASSISGVSAAVFAEAVSVLWITSLLCRVFGFFVYLLWGRLSYAGYLTVRVFGILLLFATAAYSAALNPLLLLYHMNKGVQNPLQDSYRIYVAAAACAILLLTVIDNVLVSKNVRTEKTE